MPHVPNGDSGPGAAVECPDPQCVAGGVAAVHRDLRARQGPRGQGPVGTLERPGSPGAVGTPRRPGPAGPRGLRIDAERAPATCVNMRAYLTAMAAHKYADRVERDVQSGIANGVEGTPSIFINGERYRGKRDEGTLREAIKSNT